MYSRCWLNQDECLRQLSRWMCHADFLSNASSLCVSSPSLIQMHDVNMFAPIIGVPTLYGYMYTYGMLAPLHFVTLHIFPA